MKKKFDWSSFRLGVWVQASPAKAYRALATAAGLVGWFPNVAYFEAQDGKRRSKTTAASKGDSYYMYFVYGGGADGTGKVLATRKNAMIKMGLGRSGEVTIKVKKSGRGTLVELVQEKMPTTPAARVDVHMGYRTGWTFFLTNLKATLEGGFDLRESDPKRAKMGWLVNM